MPTFNFSSYYLNATLSDVDILIAVRSNDGQDSSVQAVLPGHGIVLANVSDLFKHQIEQGAITLDVQHDQLEAAQALVQYVYQGVLPVSQQELVHTLHLSHRFAVPACTAACLEALLPVEELQLDAIHVVFSLLSATCCPDFESLVKKCLDHLEQQLGDLEATLSDPALLHSLQQLPLPALLALLHDDRTSAASENTVLAAVQIWLAAQPAPVDAEQRQQLAAAVRIPLLEPTCLATVVPRIPWLLEILGPAGLAAAAGAARGIFDPHAEPCLSNPRACGGLPAGWLKGPRPLPASCMSEEQQQQHEGPMITIEWTVSIEQVKEAFEAACAAAAASAARRAAEAAAAAAAASQQGTAAGPAAGPGGSQGWGAASNAVSAAAAAAVSFGASMFRKRKRAEGHQEQQQEGEEAGAAAVPVLPEDDGYADENLGSRKQQCRGKRRAAAGTAGLAGLHSPSRSGNAAGTAAVGAAGVADAAAVATAGHDPQLDLAVPSGGQARQRAGDQPLQQHSLKLYSPDAQFAGHTWRLVLYFQATKMQNDSGDGCHPGDQAAAEAQQHAAAAGARGGAGMELGGGIGTPRAAAIAVAAGHHSQQQQSQDVWKADGLPAASPAAAAAAGAAGGLGHAAAFGSQQTPSGSRRGRRAVATPRAATADAGADVGQRGLGAGVRAVPATPPARGTPAAAAAAVAAAAPQSVPRQAVSAAAAVRLPDSASPAAKPGAAAAAADTAGVGAAAAADSSWVWHVRLAIEARPCIALQPGVSTVAFSGSLAVKLAGSSDDGSGSRARQVSVGIAAAGGAAAAGPSGRAGTSGHHRQQRLAGMSASAAAAKGRVVLAGPGAAAASRAPRSSSTAIGLDGAGAAAGPGWEGAAAAGRSAGVRRAAATAAAAKIAAASLRPDSDAEEEDEEDDDVEIVEDSDEEQGAAAAAAAGRGRSRGGGRTAGSGRDRDVWGSTGSGRGSALGSDADGDESDEDVAGGGAGHKSKAAAAAAVGGCDAAGDGGAASSWCEYVLPQGSWVKSRRCDTGFSKFFAGTEQQVHWDEEVWAKYLQPDGTLQLKGSIWNVR